MPITIILLIFAILIVMFVIYFNQFKKLQVKIDEAVSDIDVALEKRYDTLTKMFDIAKGYAKFEKDTLIEIVQYRSNMPVKDMNEVQRKMNTISKNIDFIAEQYPQLQSNQQFVVLQKQIVDCEEHLQAARRFYNANVSALNTKVSQFPGLIFANVCGVKKSDFFVADEEKKKDVEMKFEI